MRIKNPRLKTIIEDYGEGGGSSANYFYLVVKAGAAAIISKEDIQSFYRAGVNTTDDYSFVFVDIASDRRLEDDLAKIDGGKELFAKIEQCAPVFLISPQSIRETAVVDEIELFAITTCAEQVNVIYSRMGLHSLSRRKAAIEFLRGINGYLNLKPNVLGLGANLNQIISDLLDRLEKKLP